MPATWCYGPTAMHPIYWHIKGQSHAAGYYFLSSCNTPCPQLLILCHQIMAPSTSFARSCGKLSPVLPKQKLVHFLNAQTACPIFTALDEMGHSQLATPLQTDNNMACGIINDTIKQKCSKAIDMHFYWICNQACQGQFYIFWHPGNSNCTHYFSKHHPAKHHQTMQYTYL